MSFGAFDHFLKLSTQTHTTTAVKQEIFGIAKIHFAKHIVFLWDRISFSVAGKLRSEIPLGLLITLHMLEAHFLPVSLPHILLSIPPITVHEDAVRLLLAESISV